MKMKMKKLMRRRRRRVKTRDWLMRSMVSRSSSWLVVNLDAKLEMVNSRIEVMRRASQYPVEVGSVLNNSQYAEMPLSLSFCCHDQLCFGGSCNPMIGDFVDWSNAGHMGMQEVAPWEKMLM